jgi:hypothetical protein
MAAAETHAPDVTKPLWGGRRPWMGNAALPPWTISGIDTVRQVADLQDVKGGVLFTTDGLAVGPHPQHL